MALIGALRDLVEHDRARLLWAVGQKQEAIRAQRYALRLAPPDRRSFHGMALAAFLFFCGDLESALRAAVKAERWSHRDRALVRAFRALIELSLNRTPEEIEEIQRAL
ncbi:MAG: hypothetical protein RMJ84_13645, partial [Sandaracinaceae bacterium]|nr:hypothetical protein [Sandaracinaceae bacterium]